MVSTSIRSSLQTSTPKTMTLQELNQLVALGEGLHLEFKRRVPKDARIAREVIALANTKGGRILLGVSDDGTVRGVGDVAEEEFVLRRALQAHCRPPAEYTTERVPVADRRDVIVVSVPESAQKPHFLVIDGQRSPGTAYLRAGEMSVEASPEAVQLMREEKSARGATFEFGENEMLLMRYLEDYARVTVDQFARMAGISPERASETLVALAKANILRLQADREEDYFTLAYGEK